MHRHRYNSQHTHYETRAHSGPSSRIARHLVAGTGPKRWPNYEEVNLAAIAQAHVLLPSLFPKGRWEGHEYLAFNPKREDRNLGSFSINWRTGRWKDFATGEGGKDFISLYAWLFSLEQGAARIRLSSELGMIDQTYRRPKISPPPVSSSPRFPRSILPVPAGADDLEKCPGEISRWAYLDPRGNLLLYRVRTLDPLRKLVKPWTWCQTGPGQYKWVACAPPKPWPIFGLDRLAANPTSPVLVVEGEKTAVAAETRFIGWVAVTSGSAESAGSADWTSLKGRNVVIWPDADVAGFRYALKVFIALTGIAASIRIVPPSVELMEWVKPGRKASGGWDLADSPPSGVDLQSLLTSAVPFGEWIENIGGPNEMA